MLSQVIFLLKTTLVDLSEVISLRFIDFILQDLARDLHKLEDNDPTFLDGLDGFVDYYSPHADAHIANEHRLLEKYHQYTIILEATLICIEQRKKIAGSSNLSKLTDPDTLAKEKDISRIIETISHFSRVKFEMTFITCELSKEDDPIPAIQRRLLMEKKSVLEQQFKAFYDEIKDTPGFQMVDKRKINLEFRININRKIHDKIPEGMLDIKRVLGIHQEKKGLLAQADHEKAKRLNHLKFSDSKETDEALDSMFDEIRRLMVSCIKDYANLVTSGGEIRVFLHEITAFYWESLRLYREMIGYAFIRLNATKDLTPTGRLVATCVRKALEHLPSEEIIHQAFQHITAVSRDLSTQEVTYATLLGDKLPSQFYQDIIYTFIKDATDHARGPFFYIPSQATRYVFDHPPDLDLGLNIGNCLGESLLFLQNMNTETPRFNHLCPERELINFQLNQSKKTIGKKPVLISQEVNKTSAEGPIVWQDIKDILLKRREAKYGHLNLLRFGKSTLPGFEYTVCHLLAFITLSAHDAHYPYVIYDYNLGAMGFRDPEQLRLYLETVLEMNNDFYSFKLEQHHPMRASTFQYLNQIHPLTLVNKTMSAQPLFWDPFKLRLLTTYGQAETHFILEQIQRLEDSSDRLHLHQMLIEHQKLSCEQLVTITLKERTMNALDFAMTHAPKFAEAFSKHTLKPGDATKVASLVLEGHLQPRQAIQRFKGEEKIVKASYHMDASCLALADLNVITRLAQKNIISFKTAALTCPDHLLFEHAAFIEAQLEQITSNAKDTSKEEQHSRVERIQACAERMHFCPIPRLQHQMDKLTQWICFQFLGNIRGLSKHREDIPKDLAKRIRNTSGMLLQELMLSLKHTQEQLHVGTLPEPSLPETIRL